MEIFTHHRRIQRVRHEVHMRDVVVSRVTPVGASFVAVTFSGESLANFVSDSFDDHIKLILTDARGETFRRDYTPRHFSREKQELTIEFALHADGKASDWARQATPGQRAVIGGPRGSMIIPIDYPWHLLIGDASALPAMRRRIEELPATAHVQLVALLAHAADRQAFASRAPCTWVDTDQALLATIATLTLPAGTGFVWAAGESTTMRQLRDMLVVNKQHPKEALRIAAYWQRGTPDFHERLDA